MSDTPRTDAAADWDKQKESFLKFYEGAPLATVARLAHENGYVSAWLSREREVAELRGQLRQAMAHLCLNEALRKTTIEECAKVAESVGRPAGASDGSTYIPGTSGQAAVAIRALKGKP